jgi:hypothetical protein
MKFEGPGLVQIMGMAGFALSAAVILLIVAGYPM